MKRLICLAVLVGLLGFSGMKAFSQPPDDRFDGPPRGEQGPPPPRPWQPGKVMPPPVREALKLTDVQNKQIDELEKEVKEKILKILTSEQQKQLETLKLRGPQGPPPGEGGPRFRQGPPPGEDGPPPRRGRGGDRRDRRPPPPPEDE